MSNVRQTGYVSIEILILFSLRYSSKAGLALEQSNLMAVEVLFRLKKEKQPILLY